MSKNIMRYLIYVLCGLLIFIGCAIGATAQSLGDSLPWFRIAVCAVVGGCGILYGHFIIR